MNDSTPNKEAEGLPAPGHVRIVMTIEGPINGHTSVVFVTTGVHRDGSVDGPQSDEAEADSLMGGIMLASAELHKLGLLMGYDIVEKIGGSLYGTGDGIENAHAAADYAANEEGNPSD